MLTVSIAQTKMLCANIGHNFVFIKYFMQNLHLMFGRSNISWSKKW
jgi:hypothetical protein